jgi:hypothetical protein
MHPEEIDTMEKFSSWKSKTKEDILLYSYWKKVGGIMYTEVPIGGPGGPGKWPIGCTRRRLDGVRIISRRRDIKSFKGSEEDFFKLVNKYPVEIIEVKNSLNRTAIGQIIAGHDMFTREYKAFPKKNIILCSIGDSALEWVCKQRNIIVKKIHH